MKKVKKSDCVGCRDNFYNGNNSLGVKECWSLASAKLIQRKQVPLDQRPPWDQPYEKRPSCYKRSGYVFVNKPEARG